MSKETPTPESFFQEWQEAGCFPKTDIDNCRFTAHQMKEFAAEYANSLSESKPDQETKEHLTPEEIKQQLIEKHINFHPTELEMLSVKFYVDTGNISGSFHEALMNLLDAYANSLSKPDQETLNPDHSKLLELYDEMAKKFVIWRNGRPTKPEANTTHEDAILFAIHIFDLTIAQQKESKEWRQAQVRSDIDCPFCGEHHIDKGEWAKRLHKKHKCEKCGNIWKPYEHYTFGI